ncbi:hypothetical protein Goarm_013281, partial [Gossypium armourianum]|nr:hypothetical protein [Gossypium armourianum]
MFSEKYSRLKEFVANLRLIRDETIFLKKSGWQFSRVSKTKTLNGGPI